MKKVVITGATSMIGSALAKECVKNGTQVLALVRKNSSRLDRLPDSELIKLCECELDDMDSIGSQSEDYDVFYHMAWGYTTKAMRDDPILQAKNIKYTFDAVNLAQRLGCKKFIGAGSQAEYGKVDSVISPETPVAPLISYGTAKYAAGMLSRKLCEKYSMVHIWARIFSVYGRNDNEGTMLNYAIDSFIEGRPARFSSASQLWDYLHEDDAARMFYLMGERVAENKVYCVASGSSRPLKEFIIELKDAFGPQAECVFAPASTTENAVSLQANIEGLAEDIDYRPQIEFRKGIEDMISFRRQILSKRGGVTTGII